MVQVLVPPSSTQAIPHTCPPLFPSRAHAVGDVLRDGETLFADATVEGVSYVASEWKPSAASEARLYAAPVAGPTHPSTTSPAPATGGQLLLFYRGCIPDPLTAIVCAFMCAVSCTLYFMSQWILLYVRVQHSSRVLRLRRPPSCPPLPPRPALQSRSPSPGRMRPSVPRSRVPRLRRGVRTAPS